MAISVLDNQKTSLETVLDSNTFSLTRTKANSHTTAFSLGFETFHPKILGVMTQEIQLQMQTAQAEAIVSAAGEALSDTVDLVGQVMLLACGGDRTAALYVLLFGTQRPSAVKKLKLSERLTKTKSWILPLKNSPQASISAAGVELEAKVKDVQTAFENLSLALQEIKQFRTVGAKAALIDEFNGLRALTYGQIAEFAHTHPELNLPSRFADRFFKHERARKAESPEDSSSEALAEEIERKEEELLALKDVYAKALVREQEEAKAEVEAEALKAELSAAQKEQEMLETKVAALKAKVAAL